MLTQTKLKEILNYNPDTGIFTWKIDHNNGIKKGSIAGSVQKMASNIEYIYIGIPNYGPMSAHRLAWLFMTGTLPQGHIDHINGNGLDNRWVNLRDVDIISNSRNRKGLQKNNTSGITGVWYDKGSKIWRAYIIHNKKTISIGRYLNKIRAIEARWLAEIKYNYPNCFTMSSAYLFLKQNSLKINVNQRIIYATN